MVRNKRIENPHDAIVPMSDLDFSGFIGRTEGLTEIYRYKIYEKCFYRSNLETHARRVYWLMRSVLRKIAFLFPEADLRKMQIMALVHDDAEILTGDFPSVTWFMMTAEQLAEIDNKEEVAITKLSESFPKTINGYSYAELLTEILEKSSVEAQLVKFFDHLDGFGEALHEIYAGNVCFVTSPNTEVGKVPIPPDYYIPRFANPEKYYPLIASRIGSDIPFSRNFERIDFEEVATRGKPHSEQSVKEISDYPLYDWWKISLLEAGDDSVAKWLLRKTG